MNMNPGHISIDWAPGSDCSDMGDRCRGFASQHDGGVLFVFGDSSTRMLPEDMDSVVYRALSSMNGDEVVPSE